MVVCGTPHYSLCNTQKTRNFAPLVLSSLPHPPELNCMQGTGIVTSKLTDSLLDQRKIEAISGNFAEYSLHDFPVWRDSIMQYILLQTQSLEEI